MLLTWIRGIFRARWGMVTAAAGGIALAVCLLAILGIFIQHSAGSMTTRAVGVVSPDWQIQLVGTTDPAGAADSLKQITDNPRFEQVDYADVNGFSSNSAGTTQDTGAGKVVGLNATYFQTLPNQARLLAGSWDGALLAQQTAANLHAGLGDTVSIARLGRAAVEVKITGIVDLPNADQFFQIVSSTKQASLSAPPDNVLLLPDNQWVGLFGDQLETLPQTAQRQLHVVLSHDSLSPDPVKAYVQATGQANNMLAKLAGGGVIANNLAARLDGVRQDALFAKVLFLFLGAPGAVVAILLTLAVASAGAERRQHEVALMQLRGFKRSLSVALLLSEALMIGIVGSVAGIVLTYCVSISAMRIAFQPSQWPWYGLAACSGLAVSLLVVGLPAAIDLRRPALENMGEIKKLQSAMPAWKTLWLDIACLAGAAFFFWQSSAGGYQVVAAPEGVATAVVDYKAYLGPGLLWVGAALLLLRLWQGALHFGGNLLTALLKPLSGRFAKLAAASISHDRTRIVKGIVLVTVAFAFATSTAIFNRTYQQQASVDAALTTGADVAVVGSIDNPASPTLEVIKKVTGIASADLMQHRFAYVGVDLQDLYGINPDTITNATAMSDAFFANGSAASTLATLKATADGILVSDETVSDFQLQQGDTLNLRLRHAGTNDYKMVPFKFVGIVREFPTAPRDSFLVANAAYVANQTGIPTAETILVKSAIDPHELAQRIQTHLPPNSTLKVNDVSTAAHIIGSSLTAVDLVGLTKIEIAFALPLVGGALGLVFALGLAERRRNYAVLTAIGATRGQLARLIWSEGALIYAGGFVGGAALGWLIAWVLVKLMTQVFDPPPDALAVPWTYLPAIAGVGFLALIAAIIFELRQHTTGVPKS